MDFRARRCPGFMENMLRQLESLKHQGMFFLPSRPDVKAPYVATRDIASIGSKLLLDRSWTGPGGVAVLGAALTVQPSAGTSGRVRRPPDQGTPGGE